MGCSTTRSKEIFKIVKEIGNKTNLCHSFLIRSEKTNEEYAYKRIDINASLPEKKKIINDIKILKKINHPNIILLKSAYYSTNNKYLNIITEYADGGDLQTHLNEKLNKENKEYLDKDNLLNWFVQICLALKYIHKHNILHRDIKPSNIYLMKKNEEFFAKLGDFNVAKDLSTQLKYTKTRVTTPEYLAPEIYNKKEYDSKADIWSLGVTFYQLITLSFPYEGKNVEEIQNNIINGKKKEIPKDCIVDPQFINLINEMLSIKPDERPSADEILEKAFVKSSTECYLSINKFDLKASKLAIKNYEKGVDNEFNKNIFFIIKGVDINEDDIRPFDNFDEEESIKDNESRIKKAIYDLNRQMTIMTKEVIRKTKTLP